MTASAAQLLRDFRLTMHKRDPVYRHHVWAALIAVVEAAEVIGDAPTLAEAACLRLRLADLRERLEGTGE